MQTLNRVASSPHRKEREKQCKRRLKCCRNNDGIRARWSTENSKLKWKEVKSCRSWALCTRKMDETDWDQLRPIRTPLRTHKNWDTKVTTATSSILLCQVLFFPVLRLELQRLARSLAKQCHRLTGTNRFGKEQIPSQALKKHKSTQYVYVILCLCSSSLLKTKTICACIMYILYKNWINT